MSKPENLLVGKNGEELEVRKPTRKTIVEAGKVYNAAFSEAVTPTKDRKPLIVRDKLDDILRAQGLWDDEKEANFQAIKKQLIDNELILQKGGIKLSEARSIAVEMIRLRDELRKLITQRSTLDNNTAEGQADNARFDYLVSACLVYKNTGKPYFSSLEAYLDSDEDVASHAAVQLSTLLYGIDEDFESKLPEYRFLKKFKLVDEKLRFVNKEGRLVDSEGRLINEKGRLVNESGQLIDREGRLVDEEGNFVVDEQPFLDDDGNAVVLEEPKPEVNEEGPVPEEVS